MVIDLTREQLEYLKLAALLRRNQVLSAQEDEDLEMAIAKITWALNETGTRVPEETI